MRWLLAAFAAFAMIALAADISGNWKATAEGPNGAMERTFTFKVDGNKVTGESTSSMMGKSQISDGKIEGDTVTFTLTGKFGDNEVKLNYKGKINGNEIKFTSEMAGGGGQAIEWVAKKM
ncbi:MAG TPA: hypothetical protein VMH28_02680 [Candidatus Acidoferrales bacterium]|nr:hypothetical protein [Candidatus Acidoferrales bacterium]